MQYSYHLVMAGLAVFAEASAARPGMTTRACTHKSDQTQSRPSASPLESRHCQLAPPCPKRANSGHSTMSPARNRKGSGTVEPITLAVFRLITSSNFVGRAANRQSPASRVASHQNFCGPTVYVTQGLETMGAAQKSILNSRCVGWVRQ